MTEREQLREALTKALEFEHEIDWRITLPGQAEWFCSCGAVGLDSKDAHRVEAVLAVLDQQGWPNPHALSGARARADAFESLYLEAKAERDAALREAARYEQVAWYSDKDMWVWRYPNQATAPGGYPDVVPLYRRVTEAGEG